MANPLIPEVTGQKLTVDLALQMPKFIRKEIAELAGPDLVLDKFFSPGPPPVGGSYLFVQAKREDQFTENDVEVRTIGSEYVVVKGVDPTPKLAPVQDFGGKFDVPDERKIRNDSSYLTQNVTQLKNTIVRKLNSAALAVVEDVITNDLIVPAHKWDDLVFLGPEADLTPSGARPSADISAARLAADLDELGHVFDLLIVHPQQAHDLRSAYGENLDAMLKSAGVEMFVTGRITPGAAFVLEKGGLGKVGFERPLTVETFDDRKNRTTWVQAFAVPYFGTENPRAVRKLIGLA